MTMNGVDRGILAELWHSEFTKKRQTQKDADSARSAVLAYFPSQISQQRFIQSIWFRGRCGLVL